MAALMRHGVFKTFKTIQIEPTKNAAARSFATKAEKRKGIDKKKPPRIESSAQSISAKGFLRPQNSYVPPANVDDTLDKIFRENLGATEGASPIDRTQKFNILTACSKEFSHSVPNSLLYKIETLNDIRVFYQTEVDTVTPLDKLKNMRLPENLHVQYDYHRFHPETDTMFNGQTAFNRSSTLVTGLKYRGKYKGHIQNQTWPFNS